MIFNLLLKLRSFLYNFPRRVPLPQAKAFCWGITFTSLSVLAPLAFAVNCPGTNKDECEELYVYRIQTWPSYMEDANNVSMVSLSEANAGDLEATNDLLKGYKKGASLAIRYHVWRMTTKPETYCNCNLELNGKGCPPNMRDDQLKLCARKCLTSGKECAGSGVDVKSKGHWYAFPAMTEFEQGKTWKKNTFKIDANAADWSSDTRIIKQAECIANALSQHPEMDINLLFDDQQPCPTVSQTVLDETAKKR